jgi:phosphoribosylanthranilate isomerase
MEQIMARIKICGITELTDALNAVTFGADALGYIFYNKSKRYINPESARNIIAEIPPFTGNVGVFVNEEYNEVVKIAEYCGLTSVQLHGDEDAAYINNLSKKYKAIRGFGVKDESVLHEIEKMKLKWFLLDAYAPEEKGGTGRTFNWEIVERASKLGNVILAGGINSDNIHEALSLSTYALDISSGVENAPGKKSKEKLREIFNKIKIYGSGGTNG